MEIFLQYLDDLDDLFGILGLVAERLRRVMLRVASFSLIIAGAIGGTGLAVLHPPIALATSILLFVTLLYRRVTASNATFAQSV